MKNPFAGEFKRPLAQSRVLWVIIISWLVTMSAFIILIDKSLSHLPPCTNTFSPTCLSNFSENMSFPLKISTFFFALIGFWSLLFRSHQTNRQIEVTEQNNNYNNFISHKKEFESMLEAFEKHHSVEVIDINGIYKSLFPYNSNKYFNLQGSQKFIDSLEKKLSNIYDQITGMTTNLPILMKDTGDPDTVHKVLSIGLVVEQEVKGLYIKTNDQVTIRVPNIEIDEFPKSVGLLVNSLTFYIRQLTHFSLTKMNAKNVSFPSHKAIQFMDSYYSIVQKKIKAIETDKLQQTEA